MLPPKVFAIYRRETETFQFLTYETDEENTILRLKNWSQPRYPRGVSPKDKDGILWSVGTDWYVEPKSTIGQPKIYQVNIHDKTYYWWPLNYKLVWFSYMKYYARDIVENGVREWEMAPQIPVIEFNSKHIYPRLDVLGFYPRWSSVKPTQLEDDFVRANMYFVSQRMKGALEGLTHENLEPKCLSIRTPISNYESEEESFTPTDINDSYETTIPYNEESTSTCIPLIMLTFLLGSIMGTWTMIGLQIME